ncbi:conserved hypothetical protein [uncultured Stenotrophomonas sp.]|uniref:Minor coat protein n=1 Tax=uncultured Stenotrophomonas sp. TaxID=165438 RepID=A0A1Y5Q5E3_9GAMM|nr:conserved hypothetical protein [uncultured Stenotrophomonas sp.]
MTWWMQAGWLGVLTNWLLGLVQKFWAAIEAFFNDLIVTALEKLLELAALAFESLPVPDFMTQHSIGSLLGNAGPTVGWFVETFKIPECMSLLAAGLVFKITRKIVTFGKW